MQKLRFFFLLILFPSLLFAQEKSKVQLISSSSVQVDNKKNISYLKNPTFKHDNATLSCDSAVFYNDLNYFEAFRNVHINQADTVNIFSDLLNYEGNKKMAHLINNVRMVDPKSTLTTNILDYDMALKIGTYINGGKIVNKDKDVTLTSKKGWYFANTSDAYFRYNVDVVTPQANIKSDTLVYNTTSNWAFFHGPTNIKGKDDNLYTENGAYNTKSENALFGKKNLYTQGTKSLKGDSLYYFGKLGYGKAVKNIVFIDTEDKMLLRGQLGEYYKIDERVVVTKNAYIGMGTADSVLVNSKKIPDSLWIGADTLQAQMVLQKTLTLIPTPVILKDNEIGAETEKEKKEKAAAKAQAAAEAAAAKVPKPKAAATKTEKKPEKLSRKERKEAEKAAKEAKDAKDVIPPVPKPPDSTKLKPDSIRIDSVKKETVKKDSLLLSLKKPVLKDSTKTIEKAIAKDVNVKNAVPVVGAKTPVVKGIVQKPLVKDTLPFNPADTVRTRAIKAYHNVRVFKANLQAKSDSLFYTAADSTLRWYQDPMIWSENSQQTGDTIYVQFKNKKINTIQVLKNGFMVNTEGDSTKFNQVKGKLITGFFSEGELRTMYVDGNAESIYFTKDNDGDHMNQMISGRIKFTFKDKELKGVMSVKDNEGAYSSNQDIPKESHLTGFIWKPELRPTSKADIIKGRPIAKKEVKPSTTPSKTTPKGKDPSGIKPILPTKKPTTDNTKNAGKSLVPVAKPILDKVKMDSVKVDTTKTPVKN
ncbi:OstA-like protein [Pedobacter sp. Hv1]|uniref:OstA-like protein n=1 Tax=Pedobacter sp. Hv1 TaxID=1740090 RepID=UPI0009E984DE|nr:OstA-like protein [Pedobacter sp. Hv1]